MVAKVSCGGGLPSPSRVDTQEAAEDPAEPVGVGTGAPGAHPSLSRGDTKTAAARRTRVATGSPPSPSSEALPSSSRGGGLPSPSRVDTQEAAEDQAETVGVGTGAPGAHPSLSRGDTTTAAARRTRVATGSPPAPSSEALPSSSRGGGRSLGPSRGVARFFLRRA